MWAKAVKGGPGWVTEGLRVAVREGDREQVPLGLRESAEVPEQEGVPERDTVREAEG